jgi:hypothetical protein
MVKIPALPNDSATLTSSRRQLRMNPLQIFLLPHGEQK